MALVSTPAVVVWFLVLAGSGWALAQSLLLRPRRRREWGEDLYCGYCHWPLSRTAGYEVYRWQGHTFCSLVCLRQDAELRGQEECLERGLDATSHPLYS